MKCSMSFTIGGIYERKMVKSPYKLWTNLNYLVTQWAVIVIYVSAEKSSTSVQWHTLILHGIHFPVWSSWAFLAQFDHWMTSACYVFCITDLLNKFHEHNCVNLEIRLGLIIDVHFHFRSREWVDCGEYRNGESCCYSEMMCGLIIFFFLGQTAEYRPKPQWKCRFPELYILTHVIMIISPEDRLVVEVLMMRKKLGNWDESCSHGNNLNMDTTLYHRIFQVGSPFQYLLTQIFSPTVFLSFHTPKKSTLFQHILLHRITKKESYTVCFLEPTICLSLLARFTVNLEHSSSVVTDEHRIRYTFVVFVKRKKNYRPLKGSLAKFFKRIVDSLELSTMMIHTLETTSTMTVQPAK